MLIPSVFPSSGTTSVIENDRKGIPQLCDIPVLPLEKVTKNPWDWGRWRLNLNGLETDKPQHSGVALSSTMHPAPSYPCLYIVPLLLKT